MKLVVGLGNPDSEYENTFHNLGFICADKVAEKLNAEFKKSKFRALVAQVKRGSEKIIIAKPTTYMNLSGEAVKELVEYYKIDNKDLIVCYDDYDLPLGAVRIREEGSAGTHNGMRNILLNLGTEKFARIRVGFKPGGENKIPLINYVLSGIKKEDKPLIEKAVEKVACAVLDFLDGASFDVLMQKYNGKTE